MNPQRISEIKAVMGIVHGSRAFGGPFQAAIEVTNRCNIRCIHCYYYSPFVEKPNFFALRRARRLSGELPAAQDLRHLQTLDADGEATRNLIDTLVRMGTRKFFFSGSGEPFLHRDILDFIGQAKRAGSTCVVYTNGTLLDRRKMDMLVTLQCNELKITPLAGSREVYVRTHPGIQSDAFDNLQDNLIYLADRKAKTGTPYPEVSLHYVVIPQNCDDLGNFVEFAGDVRAKRVLFRPVDTVGDAGLETSVVLTDEQVHAVKRKLSELRARIESRGIENNLAHFLTAFGRKMDTAELYRRIPCYYGWLGVRFDVQGNVYPCCRCYEPMGNIQRQGFRTIWRGDRYRTFRREARRINKRSTSINGCACDSCPHFTANLLVFNALHPLKGRTSALRGLSPPDME